MGRAPCCDKASVNKGPWSPEEDAMLKGYIEKHGTGGNWIALPKKAGLRRCGKSCRLRWLNYLRPNIKHGDFTDFEDRMICTLYASIGSRWSVIAAHLPERTDNDIKNYWNTKLKKKFTALLAPLPSIPHRSSLTSSLQSNINTFISAPLPPLNSHSHQIPSPPLPALVSPSYSILPALRSPSKKEINFENPMQQYQMRKDGNSVNFGGGSGEATSSLSEGKYDFGRPCSSTAGGAQQAASYGHYPCRAVEEKENLLPASGRGDSSGCAAGGGWTQVVVADQAWGENTTTADYGFEQFEQLLVSTNISNCSFSFDENKVGEIACITDRLWC